MIKRLKAKVIHVINCDWLAQFQDSFSSLYKVKQENSILVFDTKQVKQSLIFFSSFTKSILGRTSWDIDIVCTRMARWGKILLQLKIQLPTQLSSGVFRRHSRQELCQVSFQTHKSDIGLVLIFVYFRPHCAVIRAINTLSNIHAYACYTIWWDHNSQHTTICTDELLRKLKLTYQLYH